METKHISVELFTIPQAACDSNKANWTQVGDMVKNQLETRFDKLVEFGHIEFMSSQWFDNQKVQEMLEEGSINFPFVLVDGEVASADKKINISKIIRAIQVELQQ